MKHQTSATPAMKIASNGNNRHLRIMLSAQHDLDAWKRDGMKGAWWHKHVKKDQK